ncbi:MAG: CoA-binding protein, partial [Nitrososphaerota archaeon]
LTRGLWLNPNLKEFVRGVALNALSRIFSANSVAIIGASLNPEKRGHIILKNIIEGGFKGRIYPVNPNCQEILGLKAYPSIQELPEDPDLLILSIPRSGVPKILKEAKGKKIQGAIVISGGFREAGNDELERELLLAAKESGIRVIGPNCQGLNFTPSFLCASWPLIKKKGPIAIISQSGTVGATLCEWAEDEGIGISGFVSLGNRVDIDETELLAFFGEDYHTRSIALYLEGVKRGRDFMDTLKMVSKKKPVIILKGGRTERGKEAAQSHTRSVAGSDAVFDGVCRQCGAIRVDTITELYDTAKAGAFLTSPVDSLFIVTSSGGAGILATDFAEMGGISVPFLTPEAKQALSRVLPNHCIVGNPLDLTGDADASRYKISAETVSQFKIAQTFFLIFGDPIPQASEICKELKRTIPQQIIVSYLGGGEIGKKESKALLEEGFLFFPTPERAVKAITKLKK